MTYSHLTCDGVVSGSAGLVPDGIVPDGLVPVALVSGSSVESSWSFVSSPGRPKAEGRLYKPSNNVDSIR